MTYLYHASPRANTGSIKKNGLKGHKARHGVLAVYCVFTKGQAKRIGDHRYPGAYDIWQVKVDQTRYALRVEEHPGWAGLDDFKEVLLPDSLTGPTNIKLLPTEPMIWTLLPAFEFMGDAGGWSKPIFYKTIQLVTIGSKLFVFGRGSSDLHLVSFDTSTNTWMGLPSFEFMGDKAGWNNPIYYETIRVITSGTKLFVFGRGSSDLHLVSFDTSTNTWMGLPSFEFMGDKAGWNNPIYYETIRVITSSTKLFVFGRGSSHLHLVCHQS